MTGIATSGSSSKVEPTRSRLSRTVCIVFSINKGKANHYLYGDGTHALVNMCFFRLAVMVVLTVILSSSCKHMIYIYIYII